MHNFADAKQILLLGIALAVGLLIGIERGWKLREAKEGERIAGLRTYGLIGLLGGTAGLLFDYMGSFVFALVFMGFTIAVTAAYILLRINRNDASITSLVTMLLTFILGSLVVLEHINLAVSSAVVTVLLLRFKAVLHAWLRKLGEQELHAALQLLLISVVLLPVLPDQGYGPWQAFNPYEAWWMVVLIAGISFVGYFTMKSSGAEKGVILTALAGGVVSSTALTLHFSRLYHKQQAMQRMLASGILLACAMMFPRMLLVASLINPVLFTAMIAPLAIMTLLTFFSAALIWRKNGHKATEDVSHLVSPLELKSALFFGALLVLVLLLGKAAVHYYGETGVYMLALLSGIADVDPINLTLSKMSRVDLALDVAVLGIVIAASTNTLVKAGLAMIVGGKTMFLLVFLPLFISAAAGLVLIWLLR
ncbi:MgtC/SapB family protein [Psychromonas sp.]|uniref:MgtC/SapB family protein n=1 Tax=Psychromonas sp. TaxID=1884585 RepID=UPI003569C8C1